MMNYNECLRLHGPLCAKGIFQSWTLWILIELDWTRKCYVGECVYCDLLRSTTYTTKWYDQPLNSIKKVGMHCTKSSDGLTWHVWRDTVHVVTSMTTSSLRLPALLLRASKQKTLLQPTSIRPHRLLSYAASSQTPLTTLGVSSITANSQVSRHIYRAQSVIPYTNQTPIRHCSHRRNMCLREDISGSSVAVAQKREVLPTNVKPTHYDLTLEPDLEKFTYKGQVTIECVYPEVVSTRVVAAVDECVC